MPRLRLRLTTLALLIVIIALAIALLVREAKLKSHVKALEAEIARERSLRERQRILHRRDLDRFRALLAPSSGESKYAGRNQPTGHGVAVAPKD
jgi:hypothetical protein